MWKKIENLPEKYKNSHRMFIVKGIDIPRADWFKYTTDPYCVWYEKGEYVRWPHEFPPTHYCELPEEVEA